MKAEILSIGTELLMGELTDTNAPFIAARLPALGIQLHWVSQVGDNMDMLAGALTTGLSRSDIVFTTGGLGPTQDDLTREAIAKALGEEMAVQDELLAHLEGYFRGRGIEMPGTNIKQATLIPSAQSIPNRRGTAPGWWVEKGGRIIVSMPGPPAELHGIWEEEVIPRLRRKVRGEIILTRNIKTSGLSEGGLDEMVSQYLGTENPYVGIYAKPDGIHLRIIARAADEDAASKLIQPVEEGLARIVRPYIWGYDDETPESVVGLLLAKKDLTLATMEFCTGGQLASTITDAPGSTSYFKGSVVVCNVEAVVGAGVPAATIGQYGVISQEVAGSMAQVAREHFKADIGMGVTGVAGPDEIDGNPVGLVHIAIALGEGLFAGHPRGEGLRHSVRRLPPRRSVVKRGAASGALIELRRVLDSL